MSDLTFLVAISFLAVAASYVMLRLSEAADASSGEIVTGIVRGTPVSRGTREGMLFGMWLPYEFAMVALAAFVALAALEMGDHVSGASVKLLAHLVAFVSAGMCGLVLVTASFGLFRYRAKLRRDKQS